MSLREGTLPPPTSVGSNIVLSLPQADCCVSCPVVLAGELEPGAKVWCHCCGLEVPKHVTDGNTSVEWGGLIDHKYEQVR